MAKKIVLDTNIWVSCFIGGRFMEIMDLILENDLTVLTSIELVEELTEVLGYKKFFKHLNLTIRTRIN